MSFNRRRAECTITARHHLLNEPDRKVRVAVALLKNPSRYDMLVEKVTELGASAIIPLITERTIPSTGKTSRWQKIALGAMKQSCRCILPEVSLPVHFDTFLSYETGDSLKVIPDRSGDYPSIRTIPVVQETVNICIGPEGGFSEDEVRKAIVAGYVPVSLGSRRLRTETAAIVAVSAVI
jgi:16S rRNA (uracil1498-N3)-methyltransferase